MSGVISDRSLIVVGAGVLLLLDLDGVITDTAPKVEAPLRVGGDVKAPTIISKVEPQYPEVARKARIAGIVIVECTINKAGDVTDVHVLKPLPFGLDQAAVEAVKRWKFKPGTLNGQPVDVLLEKFPARMTGAAGALPARSPQAASGPALA